jgi:beta-mannanase
MTMFGPVPMFHLGTAAGPSRKEAITPAAIAAGRGDAYIVGLNAAIGDFGKLVYVRPMAEMNNPINLYSYERKHDAAHSPPAYQSAFCRIFILLHGGSKAQVNARLNAQGLPPVAQDLVVNPYPGRLRVIWSPLAGVEHGANPAARYYPGDGCTDMIGNDMYSSSPGSGSFEENQALYDAHKNKPYSLPEWGLQGVDDPVFVQRICDFIKTHRRTQMTAYYESKPGSIYDLGSKPQSKSIYRKCITPLGAPPPA